MIPILYDKTVVDVATDFANFGVGALVDTTKCLVTEERNGLYECEFSYPVAGEHFSKIVPDRIVKVKSGDYINPQLFRIYRAVKPINGIAKYYAQHISYDLSLNPVVPFSAQGVSAENALKAILNNCYYRHKFLAISDITTTSDFGFAEPKSARSCFGGVEGSVLDVYGGEYEFDNFAVKLHRARGQDSGVTILYGKNLLSLNSDVNTGSTYTAVYPFVKDDEGNVTTLTEKIVEVPSPPSFGEPRTLVLDLSDKIEPDEQVTEAKLRALTNEYITRNNIGTIKQNIEISFVQLEQSKEYESMAALERVRLCDTITVRHSALGISVKAKVVKTVYNTLSEKYEKIEVGTIKKRLS